MDKTSLLLMALVLLASSCSKNKDKSDFVSGWKEEIFLRDATTDQGCLSIPKLYDGIRALDPELYVTVVPTSIAFDSEVVVRENFRRLISYGQLTLARQKMGQISSLPVVTQDGCATVTVTGNDGVAKPFTVKQSTQESLMAEAADGERIEYTWLSEQSVRSKRRYLAFDTPCSSGQKPVLVSLAKVLDWSAGGMPELVPETGSHFSIDGDFLRWAAQAVGEDPNSLYVAAPPSGRLIDFSKVIAMERKIPLAEIVSCTGAPPPEPDHPGDPDPDPNETPRDGGERL